MHTTTKCTLNQQILPTIQTTAAMANNVQIERAIAHLNVQKKPSISEASRLYDVSRSTLSRRFTGKSTSRAEITNTCHMKLSTAQEEVLIGHINRLADRGLPPTPRMVRNLAQELSKSSVGVNWVSRFCTRHQNQLHNIYLRTIDHKHKITDNSLHFEHYFNTVGYLLLFW